jgi:predicted ATPase/tRNA A-37 threonylcarbamoyl transferase component Bud32
MIGSSVLHFQILRQLGVGAMGVVYEALDTKLERKVAIKFLADHLSKDVPALRRLVREAKAISQLDHPNIGTIYSFEENLSQGFLVMALYQGETLDQRIRSAELDIKSIVRFALEMALALEHAHGQGILHRDIKPANIFVAQDKSGTERIKLLDFGLAKLENNSHHLTKANQMLGTLLYASPEQLKGQFSNQSDIWAWGCVVYEMLTREAPFAADSLGEVIGKILTATPKPLEQLRPETPDDLLYLVTKSLEKNVEDRIQSSQELIEVLEQCLFDLKSSKSGTAPMTALSVVSTDSFAKPKLPMPSSEFVGRETELELVLQTLKAPYTKMISLVGLGGMGKTRLALQVAYQVQDLFQDGAAFIDLTKIEDPSLVPTIILNALEIPINQNPLEDMLSALSFREMLLVMDNFEHIMEARETISKILDAAPKVQLLITTRESLDLHAEIIVELGGLPELDSRALEQQTSGKLFLNSAKRANASFMLLEPDRPAFKRIFQALHGSPLGLGLAATWTRMFDLSEIAAEIEQCLSILETNSPDLPVRQRGFAAVFASSWQHLSPSEQVVLAKLTVFRGGFNKDWATQVAGANIQILQSLIRKSLISRKNNHYTIHELIRQFAEKHLSKEDHTAAMRALTQACFALCRNYNSNFWTQTRVEWTKKVLTDYGSVRLALEWSEKEEIEEGAKIVGWLTLFWYLTGGYAESLHWSEQFLALSKQNDSTRVGLLHAKAMAHSGFGEYKIAKQCLQELLDINKDLGNTLMEADALTHLASLEYELDTLDAKYTLFQKAQVLYQALGNQNGVAYCIQQIGAIHYTKKEYEKSEQLTQEALEINRIINDKNGIAECLDTLAFIARWREDYSLEYTIRQEALAIFEEIQNPSSIAFALLRIGINGKLQKKYLQALKLFTKAAEIFIRIGHRTGMMSTTKGFADLAQAFGYPTEAIIFSSSILHIRELMGEKPLPNYVNDHIRFCQESGFNQEKIAEIQAQAKKLSCHEAIEAALLWKDHAIKHMIKT